MTEEQDNLTQLIRMVYFSEQQVHLSFDNSENIEERFNVYLQLFLYGLQYFPNDANKYNLIKSKLKQVFIDLIIDITKLPELEDDVPNLFIENPHIQVNYGNELQDSYMIYNDGIYETKVRFININ